jgi:cytochrome c peroxidase
MDGMCKQNDLCPDSGHFLECRRRVCAVVLTSLAFVLGAHAATPLGLPPYTERVDERSSALVQLGSELFRDKRLSVDGKVSCAACHQPERQFVDRRSRASVRAGQVLTRHTPSLVNVRYLTNLFWDGRATDLQAQALIPLSARMEHAFPDEQSLVRAVRDIPRYETAFRHLPDADEESPSIRDISAALAAYEKTLTAGDSPFDRYLYGGDRQAMTPAAIRGLALFRGRAQCASCHLIDERWALFTDDDFHASPTPLPTSALGQLGSITEKVVLLRNQHATNLLNDLIAKDVDIAALGRFVVTLDPKDIGHFKTPSLRNVAVNGPYMHDGSVTTLPEAIQLELYSRTAQRYPLVLTEDERDELLEFLVALTSQEVDRSR